jgi:DNA-binding CsgD family transcriptional regulator
MLHGPQPFFPLTLGTGRGKITITRTNVLFWEWEICLNMKTRPVIWTRLRRALRSLIFANRIMHPENDIGRALQDLAAREMRSEDEIAADLLAVAIARRQMAETNLRRWKELTQREQEVSALTCLNLTNIEIAKQLMISPETVKTHIRNVLSKFNLHSKSELRQFMGDWYFSAWVEANVTAKRLAGSGEGKYTPISKK